RFHLRPRDDSAARPTPALPAQRHRVVELRCETASRLEARRDPLRRRAIRNARGSRGGRRKTIGAVQLDQTAACLGLAVRLFLVGLMPRRRLASSAPKRLRTGRRLISASCASSSPICSRFQGAILWLRMWERRGPSPSTSFFSTLAAGAAL